jgi:hypothetical protein
MFNKLLDGDFRGKLQSSKWAKMAKRSEKSKYFDFSKRLCTFTENFGVMMKRKITTSFVAWKSKREAYAIDY